MIIQYLYKTKSNLLEIFVDNRWFMENEHSEHYIK